MIPKQTMAEAALAGERSHEIIVKLRPTNERRALTFNDTRESFSSFSALKNLMSSNVTTAVRPLFGSQARRSSFSFESITDDRSLSNDVEPELSDLTVISFRNDQDAAKAALDLSSDPLVEFAHVPVPRYFMATDPDQNRQWGLRAIDYFSAIGHPGFNNANNVKIAILDSGIDPQHPDLTGTYVVNTNFSTLGANDDSAHGTHVAGIIAALTNNGIGISGTCESRQLIVLRGLTSPYSATAYYGALRASISHGAQVLNCSLGGGYDPTEALIIRTAIARGMIVVAAMGNDFLRGNPTSYPAALPDVIAVGATDEVDRRASFSQTGNHIWITAPGTNILSTVPGYPVSLTTQLHYDSWDGTSMATPFVTAAVALLLAKKPSATLADVKTALANSAVKVNGATGFTVDTGHGRLNLAGALRII